MPKAVRRDCYCRAAVVNNHPWRNVRMTKQKPFYPPTTSQQRIRAFQVWQETGKVEQACQEAKISRSTFYYWKQRFLEDGYPALEDVRSHAPINPRRTDAAVEQEVISLKKNNPAWGKARIAAKISNQKSNKSVSPNTVRRILMDAGLWQ